MLKELKELWRFRELLYSMIERELKIRYKNSFLGFFWSLITPLATVLVITVVFKYLVRIQVDNYSAYVLAALLPFLFLQQALLDSSQSVLHSIQLVRKIYFPREILPLAIIVSNFVHFLLALVVFFAYLLVIWILNPAVSPFQWTTLYLPLLLVISLAFVTGIGLIVSALNTFYEDVKYMLSVGLYLIFYLSPIIYFSENVYYVDHPRRELIYTLYHLNPIAMLATAFRKILLAPQPVQIGSGEQAMVYDPLPLDWGLLSVAAAISFASLYIGYRTFNHLKWRFVERP
ncbi:MAG TPA: ABC transporter permease [Fimbriimonadaceae bacterium]|nr:ABC transporter permease [Fimbriimonadaceae bacterium]